MVELVIDNLSKVIRNTTILECISIKLESGKIYGLRGKNGSGKTMLMRAICGLIRPSEGKIFINGEQLGKDISFPRSVGALIENPAFIPHYTGLRNLQILASIQGRVGNDRIRESISRVGLDPEDKRKYKKYSLGMKQRLGIAAAIMEEPDLVVLDEPINALDEKGVELVRQILHDLKKSGALVIVACHDKEELDSLSDIIFTMEAGRITAQEAAASPSDGIGISCVAHPKEAGGACDA
jgi:ABC-2 type transport system ATP-binding protein